MRTLSIVNKQGYLDKCLSLSVLSTQVFNIFYLGTRKRTIHLNIIKFRIETRTQHILIFLQNCFRRKSIMVFVWLSSGILGFASLTFSVLCLHFYHICLLQTVRERLVGILVVLLVHNFLKNLRSAICPSFSRRYIGYGLVC